MRFEAPRRIASARAITTRMLPFRWLRTSTYSRTAAARRTSPASLGKLTFVVAFALALVGCSSPAGLLMVDDSYTVSQRFGAHKDEYPEIAWPTLSVVSGQSIQFDLPYKEVPGRTLHMDVFSPPPALQNKAAIILVHGGGWRSGNKSHFYPLANLLAQRGYVVLLPEYRLSVEAPYPAAAIDVTDAVAWAMDHAAPYGFEPGRVAIGGGSSGGQLAALVAYTARTPLFRQPVSSDQSLMALIDLDGVLDFTTPLALEHENLKKDKSAAGLWLEGAFEKQRARWIEASPVKHIDEHAPATLIISSGQLRFTAGSSDVLARLSALGIRNRYVEYDEVLHTFWLFEPYLSRVAEEIHAFLTAEAGAATPDAARGLTATSENPTEGE